MILSHFQLTWGTIDEFTLKIDAMRRVTANRWAEVFIDDDFDMFMNDEFTKIGKKSF